MAERRMFAKNLLHSDDFMSLPPLSQLLYFQLGLVADDEGFVNSTVLTMRFIGAGEEDLKRLIDRGYLLRFPSGVTLIVHWYRHNQVRADRFRPTECTAEKDLVFVDEQRQYCLKSANPAGALEADKTKAERETATATEIKTETEREDREKFKKSGKSEKSGKIVKAKQSVKTPATPLVADLATQDRIGEDRRGKCRSEEDSIVQAKREKNSVIILREGEFEGEQPHLRLSYGTTGKVKLTAEEYRSIQQDLSDWQRRIDNFDLWLNRFGWEGEKGHYEILKNWEELLNPDFALKEGFT